MGTPTSYIEYSIEIKMMETFYKLFPYSHRKIRDRILLRILTALLILMTLGYRDG
ncbi:MAG: hypothetical protein QXK24_01060 [Ignisphaera sp.]